MNTDFLQRLAQSFITRTNAANGNTAAAQAAQQASEGSLLRRAQAAHMLAAIPTPAEDAAKLDLTRAQAEQARAHGQYYKNPKPATVGDAYAVTDDGGNVVGFVGKRPGPDGNLPQFDTRGQRIGSVHPSVADSAVPAGGEQPAAATATPGAQPAGALPPTFRTKAKPAPKAPPRDTFTFLTDAQGNVVSVGNTKTGAIGPVGGTPAAPGQPATVGGTPVRKTAMTAQDRITSSLAGSVRANIDKMHELADKMGDEALTTGPIAGRISQAYQRVAGPDGPEGDFDFYGNAAVDLVYAKSGKQINENEMRILRQMIPNRARGNLKHQVDLFDQYANTLLQKYGAQEPQVSTPTQPAGGGGFRVVGVRP